MACARFFILKNWTKCGSVGGHIHAFFIRNILKKKKRIKLKKKKKKANAKQDPEAELLQFENYSLSSSRYDLKIVGYSLKNVRKKKYVF